MKDFDYLRFMVVSISSLLRMHYLVLLTFRHPGHLLLEDTASKINMLNTSKLEHLINSKQKTNTDTKVGNKLSLGELHLSIAYITIIKRTNLNTPQNN